MENYLSIINKFYAHYSNKIINELSEKIFFLLFIFFEKFIKNRLMLLNLIKILRDYSKLY